MTALQPLVYFKLLVRLQDDERGLFSVAHLATTLFLTIAAICVFNSGAAMVDRAKQQRQTDAVAESLGNWKARNLNAVVANQHLIGELFGLIITHHAIGGDLLDKQQAADTDSEDNRLKVAHALARGCKTGTPAYDDVASEVKAEEALLKSHIKLKKLLTYVYLTKAAAMAMQAYPPTKPAGDALEQAAHVLELAIHNEWRVLESIRQIALSLTPIKLNILNQLLPAAKQQLDRMIADYPRSQRQLADEIAQRFEFEVHILASDTRLPLREDPLARLFSPPANWQPPIGCQCPSEPADNLRHQLAKVTQLARATFPWVNYHRQPLIDRMKPLTPLSEMADHYFDHTAGVSKRWMDELQRDGKFALYVLDDYEGPDKVHEPWMSPDGSSAADKTFGLTVVTGAKTREPVGSFFFKKQVNEYSYRHATAFTWNRIQPEDPEQRIDFYCKRIVPSVQANTGWDTLNWSPADRQFELVGFGIPQVFPAIQPSWTSRLTPTSSARLLQIQTQPMPGWVDGIRNLLPDNINEQIVGL